MSTVLFNGKISKLPKPEIKRPSDAKKETARIMKIMIMGDVHADWGRLNTIINKKQPDIILQCGDFGYWPNFERYTISKIKNKNTKIYFCDGNHEDHDSLDALINNEIHPNVFYMKRGSTLTLPDGRNILFMGGAESIDKVYRVQGRDWFPQETITQKDLFKLPASTIDIVISHTCPTFFSIEDQYEFTIKCSDPSRKALDTLLEMYKPSEWYFGHWHKHMYGQYGKTRWQCMNESRLGYWWKWI